MRSGLYGKEYGEIQSRDLAKEYVVILDMKFIDIEEGSVWVMTLRRNN